MGFLDWIGRNRSGSKTKQPRFTWISDVYTHRGTWTWTCVQQNRAGKFDAGMTVRDHRFDFHKWKAMEGFDQEADAIRYAQSYLKGCRTAKRDMKLGKHDIQRVVRNWYRVREKEDAKSLQRHSPRIDF